MCGRYFLDPAASELAGYLKNLRSHSSQDNATVALHEVFPSNHVLTLAANDTGEIVAGMTRWGFEGFKKGQLLINARAETVEEKKTFAKAFREKRCVFPMTGFYEWDSQKNKYLFTEKTEVLYVAGFYRIHQKEAGFETESIIITTSANESVSSIHDRMPLLLKKEEIFSWINDLTFARKHLRQSMPKLTVNKQEKKQD